MNFRKIKIFCSSKNTFKKKDGQVINWEKTFVAHVAGSLYAEYIKFSNESIVKDE